MSADLFKRLALAMPGAEEKSHFGKADFRVRDRIYAGFNDQGTAYVKLLPEQQHLAISAEPNLVRPIPNAWGKKGWTLIDQSKADADMMRSLLVMAWRNVAPKSLQK